MVSIAIASNVLNELCIRYLYKLDYRYAETGKEVSDLNRKSMLSSGRVSLTPSFATLKSKYVFPTLL